MGCFYMTAIKKKVIDAWKQLIANSKEIRRLTRENKKLEAMLGKHIRSRSAWRTIKKKGRNK